MYASPSQPMYMCVNPCTCMRQLHVINPAITPGIWSNSVFYIAMWFGWI